MNLQNLEAEALNWAAGELETYKSQIEAIGGPAVLTVVNGAVKVADSVFNGLPFGIGGLIDQALANYQSKIDGNVNAYIGAGVDDLAKLLEQIATKL
jgi:hypothetical protein